VNLPIENWALTASSRPNQFFRRPSHSPFFTASIAQLPSVDAARTASIIYYARERFIFLGGTGIEYANGH
jgi:hypothetical protein